MVITCAIYKKCKSSDHSGQVFVQQTTTTTTAGSHPPVSYTAENPQAVSYGAQPPGYQYPPNTGYPPYNQYPAVKQNPAAEGNIVLPPGNPIYQNPPPYQADYSAAYAAPPSAQQPAAYVAPPTVQQPTETISPPQDVPPTAASNPTDVD